jgi:NAD(P)-dependent dehydrogenase (short-subunit alcohol dehydrogenase family)
MQARVEPLPECELLSPSGLFLITEDELSVAPYVAEALQQMGVHTAIIAASHLRSPEELASIVAQQRQLYGSVTGIVHLAALAALSMPNSLADWRYYTQIQSKSLFQLLHLCASDLQQAGQQQQGWVLAASLFGGHFGRRHPWSVGLAAGGSATGLLKTLITEWSGVQAKAIDFDGSLSPSDMAQHIINELLLPGGRIEVGYPQGQRTIFQTVPAPLDIITTPPPVTPSADWVVLVTGGARGITAEIASQMVIPGMKLVVVGRSPEPAEESPTTAGIKDIGALRQVLLDQARSQGLLPKPMQIERQLIKLIRDRSIRRNLQQFRETGAKVEYLPVDVKNEDEFGALINEIYQRHGRLDVAIHGAGIIEDKLIADKTFASLDRVFDTKVDSTFILSRYLRPESLKATVLFTSVAGRYGNRGQADYAAANEVMNRFAWQLDRQWSNTRVISINWGPWDTVGMASEGVKRQLRERGIIPIPLLSGRKFFIDELCYGRKGDTEVVAGEGPWEADEARQGQIKKSNVKTPIRERQSPIHQSSVNQQPRFVFLSAPPQLQPNSTLSLEHTFSLTSDPYLDDYRVEGKPIVPTGVVVEWMAEFVQSAWSEWTVTQVRDLKLLQPLVLETAAGKTVLFSARASSHSDSQSLQVGVDVLDPELKVPYYRAYIILQPKLDKPFPFQGLPLSWGNSADSALATHNVLFQGSRLQLMKSIERLNEQGIDAYVMPSQPSAWLSDTYQSEHSTANWLFDPSLLDAVAQLVRIWSRSQQAGTAWPIRLGAVTRYGNTSLDRPLGVALRVKSLQDNTLVAEAVFLDENNNVRLQIETIESTLHTAPKSLGSHL